MAGFSAILVLLVAAPILSLASDRAPMKNGPAMTAKEATTLMATAKTAKEHVKPAHYLNQDAEQFEAEAKDHDGMIEAYRQNATGWLSNSKYDLKPQMSANVNSIGQ